MRALDSLKDSESDQTKVRCMIAICIEILDFICKYYTKSLVIIFSYKDKEGRSILTKLFDFVTRLDKYLL